MQNQKPESKSRLDLVCLASVEPESVSWLWEPYIPVGGITLLAGDPGVGKTHLALLIAASVTIGASLPTNGIEDDEPRCREPGNAIYMTGEDDLAATIRPRFDKAGGDPERFFAIEGIVDTVEGKETRRGFSLSEMPRWEQQIAAVRPKLLIVDPIQAFLGSHVDMHRANEVRPVMDEIGKIAARYGIAVIVLCHSPKAQSDNVLHKVLGSIDLVAVARSALMAGPNPQVEPLLKEVFKRDDQKDQWNPVLPENKCVLVHIKANLSAKGPSIGYVIGDGTVSLTGPVDVSEDQLMGRTGKSPRPRQSAAEFLQEELKAGPRASTELQSSAHDRGFSPSTLKRAAKELGVICRPGGFGQPWTWALPTSNGSRLPKAPPSASESAAAQEASD